MNTSKERVCPLSLAILTLLATPATAQWQTIDLAEEYESEKTGVAAVSETLLGEELTATLFVACDDLWVRFSEAPDIPPGDHDIHTRLDGETRVRSVWKGRFVAGERDFDILYERSPIFILSRRTSVTITFPGDGGEFRWSLFGAAAAIIESCNQTQE